jgi:hypothetical protein
MGKGAPETGYVIFTSRSRRTVLNIFLLVAGLDETSYNEE